MSNFHITQSTSASSVVCLMKCIRFMRRRGLSRGPTSKITVHAIYRHRRKPFERVRAG